MPFQSIEPRRLYRQIAEQIRALIRSGEFVAGSRLPPERDLAMDTLKGVLEGKILVHNHCYRADEMAIMIDMAKEFGYHVTAFHHAVEAYKIADLLANRELLLERVERSLVFAPVTVNAAEQRQRLR